jgi:hypothetical protein
MWGRGGSGSQEVVGIDRCLLQDCPKGSFGHIACVIRNRCIPVGRGMKPDFMAAGRLPSELKTAGFQLPDDFTVSESGETTHSRGYYDGVITPVIGCGEVRRNTALTL